MLAFIASALAVLGLTSRTPHPYLTALFQFRHLVLVAAFPTLAVALASEQHVAAAIAAVAAAAWCREFGRKVRPIKRAPGEGHAGDLELVNLNAGDHRSDPAAIVKYLVERSCDVACLQEVCQAHYDIFDEALNEVYPHRDRKSVV